MPLKEIFETVSEADKPWKHAVQVVILIRNSYINQLTPDGFALMMVYPSYTDRTVWSFNSMEDMMARLAEGLTFGFDPANENEIKERLWDELFKYIENELKEKHQVKQQ